MNNYNPMEWLSKTEGAVLFRYPVLLVLLTLAAISPVRDARADQPPTFSWLRTTATIDSAAAAKSMAVSIGADKDGNAYLVRNVITNTPVYGSGTVYQHLLFGVVKYDINGNILWNNQQPYELGMWTYEHNVTDQNGNTYVVGSYTYSDISEEAVLQKYDSAGTLLWTKLGNMPYSFAGSITVDSSGVYMTAFNCGAYPTCSVDSQMLRQYDTGGNLVWSHPYGCCDSTQGEWTGQGIAAANGQEFTSGGSQNVGPALLKPNLYGYDSGGNRIFTYPPPASIWTQVPSALTRGLGPVSADALGHVYLTWTTGPFNAINFSATNAPALVITQTDYSGNQKWQQTFFNPAYSLCPTNAASPTSVGTSVVDTTVDTCGNLFVLGMETDCGYSATVPHTYYEDGGNVYIFKFDLAGNLLWKTSYNTGSFDYPEGIALDGKGHVYISGLEANVRNAAVHGILYGYPAVKDSFVAQFNDVSNVCLACTPDPNACNTQGRSCGNATDACGNVYPCGACAFSGTCNNVSGQCVFPGGFCIVYPQTVAAGETVSFKMNYDFTKAASNGWFCSWAGTRVSPNDAHPGFNWSSTDPAKCETWQSWPTGAGDGGIYNNVCVIRRTNAGP